MQQQQKSVDQNLKEFENLLEKCKTVVDVDKNNPEALSQLYKMMNYKPQTGKGERLSTDQVANFLKLNKKGGSESEMYDDIIYYD